MNLLVFTEYFPSSEDADITGGVESRAFHLLRELAKLRMGPAAPPQNDDRPPL